MERWRDGERERGRKRERDRCLSLSLFFLSPFSLSRKSFSIITNCGIHLIMERKSIRVTQYNFLSYLDWNQFSEYYNCRTDVCFIKKLAAVCAELEVCLHI